LRCAARGSRPFNSLSRDHVSSIVAFEPYVVRTFQLPLSGSPVISGLTVIVVVVVTFNSLSRDHFAAVFLTEEGRMFLSTPSLGITGGLSVPC